MKLGYKEHSFARRKFLFTKDGLEVTGTPEDSFPVEVTESQRYLAVVVHRGIRLVVVCSPRVSLCLTDMYLFCRGVTICNITLSH
jgi:hypothetical protein